MIGGTRILQSLKENIRKLKEKIRCKIDERNELAEMLGIEKTSYEELQSTSLQLWQSLGTDTTEELMSYLHCQRLKEEIELIKQDISRTSAHIEKDVAVLRRASIKQSSQYNETMISALKSYRDSFVENLLSIQQSIEADLSSS
jgi:hypothetical protein